MAVALVAAFGARACSGYAKVEHLPRPLLACPIEHGFKPVNKRVLFFHGDRGDHRIPQNGDSPYTRRLLLGTVRAAESMLVEPQVYLPTRLGNIHIAAVGRQIVITERLVSGFQGGYDIRKQTRGDFRRHQNEYHCNGRNQASEQDVLPPGASFRFPCCLG